MALVLEVRLAIQSAVAGRCYCQLKPYIRNFCVVHVIMQVLHSPGESLPACVFWATFTLDTMYRHHSGGGATARNVLEGR